MNGSVECLAFPLLVQAAFGTCSQAFGPFQGVLVNVNDCVDLVTSVITAKRVSDNTHSSKA